MKSFRIRGALGLGMMLGVQIVASMGFFSMALGGWYVPAIDGEYYLDNHGRLTEVAEHTWEVSRVVLMLQNVGWAIVFVFLAITLVAHASGWKWYASSPDYSIVLGFVMLVCMVMLITGNVLAPR